MAAKPRKKPPPQTTADRLSTLENAIRTLAYGHHTYTVFRHFVELSALALSNAADPINREAREKQYMAIVPQYKPEEFQKFPALLGMLTLALEQEPTDVVGKLYHRLEIHNEQVGQFFTSWPVCQCMAKISVHDSKHLVETQEFIRAQEPCVGSGAMVIALAEALREEGINYQQKLHVVAIDLDILCVHMAYVQLTLLHIPALVYHGDTLRMEMFSEWRTLPPAVLSPDEQAMLTFVGTLEGLLPVREVYKRLKMGAEKGTRLKTQLINAGLMVEVEVPLHAKGRNSKLLVLTAEGLDAVGLPARAGKGGALHQHLQRVIAAYAEQQGCAATVEAVGTNGKAVDIGLEKSGQRMAVELCITTRAPHELENILEDLQGGYAQVITLCIAPMVLEAIQRLVAAQDIAVASRVHCGLVKDYAVLLRCATEQCTGETGD